MIKRKRTKGQTTIYKTLRRKLKIEQHETQVLMILIDWFLVFYRHFQQYFSYIMATSFSGGRSRSTRREPPTMGK